jgi:hypothetical protein
MLQQVSLFWLLCWLDDVCCHKTNLNISLLIAGDPLRQDFNTEFNKNHSFGLEVSISNRGTRIEVQDT